MTALKITLIPKEGERGRGGREREGEGGRRREGEEKEGERQNIKHV